MKTKQPLMRAEWILAGSAAPAPKADRVLALALLPASWILLGAVVRLLGSLV